VEPFKTALFRATIKTKVLVGCFCHCFVDENNINLVDFHDTHLTIYGFPKTEYLDPYII